jgi:asparagine synthase (glutamine-hydrolysing)
MYSGFELSLGPRGDWNVRLYPAEEAPPGASSLTTFAICPRTGAALVLLGRLHGAGAVGDTEAEQALAAFVRSGAEGLAQLEGDFAAVVLPADRRRLLVRRDPLGAWPIYWVVRGETLHVSTRLLALARRCRAEVDPDFLGLFLMSSGAFVEPPVEQTAFRGLSRVRPGAVLALSPTRPAEQLVGWDWEALKPELAGLTLEGAADRYAGLLRDAVARRLGEGSVSAHLSGGMDSSSVACIARDTLAQHGRRLATLSLVYLLPGLAGERAWIDRVLAQGGPVDAHFLPGDDALDYQWFDAPLPEHDEPYAGLFRVAMERALVDGAVRAGAATILTGQGADDFLEGPPLRVAQLFRRGRLFAALAEARRWARAENISLWSALWRYAVEPNWPARLRQGGLLRGGYGRWPDLSPFAIPPWVRPDFARAHRLRDRGLTAARQMFPSPDNFVLDSTVGHWSSWHLAGPRGIQTASPFLEPRLVAFCLGLPEQLRRVPGRVKAVLADAMRAVLPEAIQARRYKRSFNEVYWGGLSRSLPRLEEMVRRSALGGLDLFDRDRLLDVMRQHALGIGDAQAGGRLNTTLALIAWLDHLGTALRRSTRAEPVPAAVACR